MIEPTAIDISILQCLNGDGGAFVDGLMYWVSAKLTFIPLYVLLLWGLYRKVGVRNFLWGILAIVILVTLCDQTANLAKMYLPKFRPSHYEPLDGLIHTAINGYRGGLYGTISSHAANSMGVAVFFCTIFNKRWIWAGLMAWVLIVSYSRIYLGVHYPFDIFFGLIEGTIWGLIITKLYKKIIKI